MRVLFTSLAHSTHYYPLVPMAWALRTAGHEVRIASQPELTDTITSTGLTAVPVEWSLGDPADMGLLGRIHDEASGHVQGFDFTGEAPDSWSWENLLRLENILVPAMYQALNNDTMVDSLVEFARGWKPDLVIWETFTIAGAIAACASGAAHARLVSGPDVSVRVRQAFVRAAAEQPAEHREDPTAEWLNWTLERLGSPRQFTEEMLTGQWTIDSASATRRLDIGVPTVPVRYVPYNGHSVVPDWLRKPAQRTRICLTVGVSGSELGMSMGEMLASLADLDVEIVATMGAEEQATLGPVPSNVRIVDFVPLNDLLPTCAAVVHHGGIGTTATAEVHGVPQLILAFGWDTDVIAQRLEQADAGLTLQISELTPALLRERVGTLLTDPRFAAGAARLRDQVLAEPSPNDIVPAVEKLVAEHKPQS